MLLFTIIVITTYVLFQALEISSFGARVAGRVSDRRALGTTLAQTIYTASRFLLIFFLPSLGFIVESGIAIHDYLNLVILAFIFSLIVSIFILIRFNKLQQYYQVVFNKYSENTIPIALIKSLKTKKTDFDTKVCDGFTFDKVIFEKTLVSFIAYIFLTTGFFIAFMFAVLFPDNRLTLSQFTAFFHGFGAVIFAFYLDPMLSRSIDSYSDDVTWLKNVYSILLGRTLSYFAMIFIVLIFLLLKNY
jgi:hypothetical protein